MPNIPSYRRQKLPSTNVGAAPLPTSAANVAGGAPGEGLASFGHGLGNLGESIFRIDQDNRKNQDLSAEADMKFDMQTAELDYQTKKENTPVEQWPQLRKQMYDDLNTRFNTYNWGNSDTQQRASAILEGSFKIDSKKTALEMAEMHAETARVKTGKQYIQSIANLDGQDEKSVILNQRAEEAYRSALSSKYTEDAINSLVADAQTEGTKGLITNLYRSGNYTEARKALEASDLSPQEKEDLDDEIDVDEARSLKVNEVDARKKQSALYAREDAGEILSRSDFEEAWEDPSEADRHYDEYKAGLKAESKGEVNFVKKGDPVVLAKTEAIIDLNPMSITEPELYELATSGIGTENITRLVDRLRRARQGKVDEFSARLSSLFNSGYFGDPGEDEVSFKIKRAKLVMEDYLKTQKPSKVEAELFFNGLITKNFSGFRRGGWEEKGNKQTYIDISGREITQRFRFGDIRTTKKDGKIVQEFYAGTNDDGDALWLPRR